MDLIKFTKSRSDDPIKEYLYSISPEIFKLDIENTIRRAKLALYKEMEGAKEILNLGIEVISYKDGSILIKKRVDKSN